MSSFLLSCFFFIFLLLSIEAYRRLDLSFLSTGRKIIVSRRAMMLFIGIDVAVAVGIGYLFIYHSGPVLLEYFYGVLFYLSTVIGCLLFVPIQNVKKRIWAAVVIPAPFFVLGIFTHWQWMQNVLMAISVVWVGAFIFRKFTVSRMWFSVALLAAMAVDAYNVFVATAPSELFSDAQLLFNGDIIFGSAILGIGDFFLASLIVAGVYKQFGWKRALMVAVCIAFARIVLRLLIPSLEGLVIPYYIVIVPIALVALWLPQKHSPAVMFTTH
ncbi:MAG: hypothetical protein WC289_03045 [Patescibacteria group bacterium]